MTPVKGRKRMAVTTFWAVFDGAYAALDSSRIDPKTGKRRNLGTFQTLAAAKKHERAVQFFKRQ